MVENCGQCSWKRGYHLPLLSCKSCVFGASLVRPQSSGMMPCTFQEGASTHAQSAHRATVHTVLKLEGVTDASAGFRTEFSFKLFSEFF